MRPPRLQLFLLITLAATGLLCAQTQPYTADGFQDLPPPPNRTEEPPPPALSFRLETEIPLPGPLPGGSLALRGQRVEVAVAGGAIRTRPEADAEQEFVTDRDLISRADDPTAWVLDPSAKARYRSRPDGVIEGQRRCSRCKSGWKKRWRLRVAGNTLAPPLVTETRVYFGAQDNRVYSVKARSGHRVWVSDVGARVSSRLVYWSGRVNASSEEDLELILTVPHGGAELIALEAVHGQPLASVRLADGTGKLVSDPLATPDGTIVVARQAYAEIDASLMVFSLYEVTDDDTPTASAAAEPPLGAGGP
jgi:hypothetical protein